MMKSLFFLPIFLCISAILTPAESNKNHTDILNSNKTETYKNDTWQEVKFSSEQGTGSLEAGTAEVTYTCSDAKDCDEMEVTGWMGFFHVKAQLVRRFTLVTSVEECRYYIGKDPFAQFASM